MAKTYSQMVHLGASAPSFSLEEPLTGKVWTLADLAPAPATVVMFICNHCPYVLHIFDQLVMVARHYERKGVQFVAINPNDPQSYPQDSPEEMKRLAGRERLPFPYLFDASQGAARAYQAVCTPDFFVYDHRLKLAYRGQFDSARPGTAEPVSGVDLCLALDDLCAGRVSIVREREQLPSMGCSIKWRQ